MLFRRDSLLFATPMDGRGLEKLRRRTGGGGGMHSDEVPLFLRRTALARSAMRANLAGLRFGVDGRILWPVVFCMLLLWLLFTPSASKASMAFVRLKERLGR
jgi:hypothetical protein